MGTSARSCVDGVRMSGAGAVPAGDDAGAAAVSARGGSAGAGTGSRSTGKSPGAAAGLRNIDGPIVRGPIAGESVSRPRLRRISASACSRSSRADGMSVSLPGQVVRPQRVAALAIETIALATGFGRRRVRADDLRQTLEAAEERRRLRGEVDQHGERPFVLARVV